MSEFVIALRLKRSVSVGEKENEAFFFASRWLERHNSKIRAEIQRGSKLSYIRILAATNLKVVQSEICEIFWFICIQQKPLHV